MHFVGSSLLIFLSMAFVHVHYTTRRDVVIVTMRDLNWIVAEKGMREGENPLEHWSRDSITEAMKEVPLSVQGRLLDGHSRGGCGDLHVAPIETMESDDVQRLLWLCATPLQYVVQAWLRECGVNCTGIALDWESDFFKQQTPEFTAAIDNLKLRDAGEEKIADLPLRSIADTFAEKGTRCVARAIMRAAEGKGYALPENEKSGIEQWSSPVGYVKRTPLSKHERAQARLFFASPMYRYLRLYLKRTRDLKTLLLATTCEYVVVAEAEPSKSLKTAVTDSLDSCDFPLLAYLNIEDL